MCNGNTWSIACANDFGINEARVICRQLGFDSNYVNYTQHPRIIESTEIQGEIISLPTFFSDGFKGCSGCEASLDECQVQDQILVGRKRRGQSLRPTCRYQAAVQCGGM